MSSYYDDASLMLLASGGAQKDGKVYSVKPTDGSGDFTFTRGSNLSATRVDASQLIEKGRENLLLQSNSFDVSANWLSSNVSETGGQAGYDGTNNAWLVDIIAGTLNQRTDQRPGGTLQTQEHQGAHRDPQDAPLRFPRRHPQHHRA